MRSGNDKFFLSRLDRAPGNGKSRVKNEAQTGAKSLSSVISISPTVDGKTLNDRLPLWNATCPASFPKSRRWYRLSCRRWLLWTPAYLQEHPPWQTADRMEMVLVHHLRIESLFLHLRWWVRQAADLSCRQDSREFRSWKVEFLYT